MSKVIFSIDSACDIPQSLIDTHGLYVINFPISMGDKTYTDRVDITPQMIYDFANSTKKAPKTSAVNAQEFAEHFSAIREKEGNYPIIHISIGTEFSLTYKNALDAAVDMKDIYIIDSASLSSGIALLVLYAADLAKEGKSAEEIKDLCQKKASKIQASFVLETLDFLYKGGRCSALKLLGANLLKIRPTIGVVEGKMKPVYKKDKGKMTEAVKKYIHRLKDEYGDKIDLTRAFVTHTVSDPGFEDEALALTKEIFGFKEVYRQTAGCTITTHCGKNTLGVLFLLKN